MLNERNAFTVGQINQYVASLFTLVAPIEFLDSAYTYSVRVNSIYPVEFSTDDAKVFCDVMRSIQRETIADNLLEGK